MKVFEILEAHGNSKVYDKCWKGYKKVPGKKRGEKGSCKKENLEEGLGQLLIAFATVGGLLLGGYIGMEDHRLAKEWLEVYDDLKEKDPAKAKELNRLVNQYKYTNYKQSMLRNMTKHKIERIINDFKNQELGNDVKEGILDFFGGDEPEVNDKGFPYFTGDEETDLPVVVYILKAYKGSEDKTLRYLVKELKYPHVKASLYIIRAQSPGVADKYAKFKPQKPKVKESATAGATSAGGIASVAGNGFAGGGIGTLSRAGTVTSKPKKRKKRKSSN